MCSWWSCLPYEVLSFASATLSRFLISVPVQLLIFPYLSIVICYWLPLFMSKLECFFLLLVLLLAVLTMFDLWVILLHLAPLLPVSILYLLCICVALLCFNFDLSLLPFCQCRFSFGFLYVGWRCWNMVIPCMHDFVVLNIPFWCCISQWWFLKSVP